MCGLAGMLHSDLTADKWLAMLEPMQHRLSHRGPDDAGSWFDAQVGVGLCHRRLSILDLSTEGHQPMQSASGRFVMVYNGEVYNYAAIREELASEEVIDWRGHSDTEVMLAAFEKWGLTAALGRFNGMFAFALWDRRERHLYLARDRLGIKPLYYAKIPNGLLFASELKALKTCPLFDDAIDRESLSLLLRRNCIPSPRTIYRSALKLPPGTVLQISAAVLGRPDQWKLTRFWSLSKAMKAGLEAPFEGTAEDAVDVLEDLICDAVRLRMVADVPLGAFLSGGIDSSTVVGAMQRVGGGSVRTFTIGFKEDSHNEAAYARKVSQRLGTMHTELIVDAEAAMAVVPKLPEIYDEPFADSSQIPTYLISELTRRNVTVSLSGDGGDELFGGYNRHVWGPRLWSRLSPWPLALRCKLARMLTSVTEDHWDHLFRRIQSVLPRWARQWTPGEKIHKLSGAMATGTPEALYQYLTSHWQHPETVVVGDWEPRRPTNRDTIWDQTLAMSSVMMFLDMASYLPDDILVKLDRASMAVSLEARVPLLDYRIVEFAWKLPLSMKIRDGQGKWILRQVRDRLNASDDVQRPKMGFAIPLGQWLRTGLRLWAEELLEPSRLQREGFFNPTRVQQKWRDHLAGQQSAQYELWDILMFQAWLEHQRR